MLLQWDNRHLIQVKTVPQHQQGVSWGCRLQEGSPPRLQAICSCLFPPCTDLQSSQIVIAAVQGEIFSYRVRGNPFSDVTTLTRCLEILQRLPDIPFSSPSSWVYSYIAPF